MKKAILRGLTALAVAGSFAGCSPNYYSTYEGYNVIVYTGLAGAKQDNVIIREKNGSSLFFSYNKNKNKVESIDLRDLPKDSPLEKYVNPQLLKEIHDSCLPENLNSKNTKDSQ